MKRNDFVTNVLKCNNFHCLASLRLVDLNRLPCHNYHCHIRLASLRLDILSLDKKSKALLLMLYFIKSYLFFIYGMTLVNH